MVRVSTPRVIPRDVNVSSLISAGKIHLEFSNNPPDSWDGQILNISAGYPGEVRINLRNISPGNARIEVSRIEIIEPIGGIRRHQPGLQIDVTVL